MPASPTGLGDLPVYLKSPVKSLLCRFLFRLMDGMPSRTPKLLDGFSAPLSTPFGNTNGFAFKEYLHRVGMQLGKLPQGNPAALIDGLGRCRSKGDTCLDTNGFCLGQRYLSKTGSDSSDPKIEGMSVTVGHIRATLLEPLAPLVKGKLINFPKLHINPALPDPAATHAGKVSFSAHLDREAAVEKVIPHVPLRNSGGIHGTDEVASPQRS